MKIEKSFLVQFGILYIAIFLLEYLFTFGFAWLGVAGIREIFRQITPSLFIAFFAVSFYINWRDKRKQKETDK